MCRSCGKVKYSSDKEYGPEPPQTLYRTTEEVLIVYDGAVVLKAYGCATHNAYLFGPGSTRKIDVNDAACLVSTGVFRYA